MVQLVPAQGFQNIRWVLHSRIAVHADVPREFNRGLVRRDQPRGSLDNSFAVTISTCREEFLVRGRTFVGCCRWHLPRQRFVASSLLSLEVWTLYPSWGVQSRIFGLLAMRSVTSIGSLNCTEIRNRLHIVLRTEHRRLGTWQVSCMASGTTFDFLVEQRLL